MKKVIMAQPLNMKSLKIQTHSFVFSFFLYRIYVSSGIRHSLISITTYYNWGDNFILKYNRPRVGVCGSWGHLLSLANHRPARGLI